MKYIFLLSHSHQPHCESHHHYTVLVIAFWKSREDNISHTISLHELLDVVFPGSRFRLGQIHPVKVVVAYQVVLGIPGHIDHLGHVIVGVGVRGRKSKLKLQLHAQNSNHALIMSQSLPYFAFMFPESLRYKLDSQMCLDYPWWIHFAKKIYSCERGHFDKRQKGWAKSLLLCFRCCHFSNLVVSSTRKNCTLTCRVEAGTHSFTLFKLFDSGCCCCLHSY